MSEEYREYKSRRTTRKNTKKRGLGYSKKLFKQTVFSIIIFTTVISPELLGIDSGKYIKDITKAALLYTIDTSSISKIFKDIYSNSIYKGEEKNENTQTTSKNL
ncbi:MAG: hypothetical protein IKW62_00855 [Clostridia bacterium]|nr:hypothetical protein [Clostridia bacterium]